MVQTEEKTSLKIQWWRWHKLNPEVYRRFVEITFDLIRQGHKRYSQDAILHVIRFELNRTIVNPDKQYKINNNFSAYYARLFNYDFPDHSQFFELRNLTSEKVK